MQPRYHMLQVDCWACDRYEERMSVFHLNDALETSVDLASPLGCHIAYAAACSICLRDHAQQARSRLRELDLDHNTEQRESLATKKPKC